MGGVGGRNELQRAAGWGGRGRASERAAHKGCGGSCEWGWGVVGGGGLKTAQSRAVGRGGIIKSRRGSGRPRGHFMLGEKGVGSCRGWSLLFAGGGGGGGRGDELELYLIKS